MVQYSKHEEKGGPELDMNVEKLRRGMICTTRDRTKFMVGRVEQEEDFYRIIFMFPTRGHHLLEQGYMKYNLESGMGSTYDIVKVEKLEEGKDVHIWGVEDKYNFTIKVDNWKGDIYLTQEEGSGRFYFSEYDKNSTSKVGFTEEEVKKFPVHVKEVLPLLEKELDYDEYLEFSHEEEEER